MNRFANPITVLVAERYPLYREGIKIALTRASISYHMLEADSYALAEKIIYGFLHLDLVIIDSQLKGMDTRSELGNLIGTSFTPVIVTTEVERSEFSFFVRNQGARGIIHKSSSIDTFTQALTAVLNGGYWYSPVLYKNDEVIKQYSLQTLSTKERRVLPMIKKGLPNKKIAEQLHLSEHTIKFYLSSIYRKLNLKNRTQLATALPLGPCD